ncbi:MAG TPA: FMN-binding protein [Atopostipes sp.]|nr:FMN-binding protein [Atopostipes sp.]
MKKLLAGLTLSSALLLAACGSDDAADTAGEGGLQDGTYSLEELNFGETGWKESLEIIVADGEITDASFSSLDEMGNSKIDSDEYQEAMSNVVEVGPQEFIPTLEESLVDVQNPADVEVVTGATSTSEKFKDYADQLVAAAEEGNTDTIEVDNQE